MGFQRELLRWYERVKRELPWRRRRDAYAIWISEIMLQQTRVAAALPFYERFMARFPSVFALAKAAEADVLTHWAGLGYYSRARNLLKAAEMIVGDGGFPESVAGLRELPGVGAYTAAAIGSMAFGLPVAAVDGNLLRVIARLDNDPSDIAAPATRARFALRAQELLDRRQAGEFNQAMMELGATVCVPRNPRCGECPVVGFCQGRAAGREGELPVKGRKVSKVLIAANVLVIRRSGRVLLRQRSADAGQMAGFWELPTDLDLPRAVIGRELGEVRHTITHHHYRYRVHAAELGGRVGAGYGWHKADEVLLTTATRKALRQAAE